MKANKIHNPIPQEDRVPFKHKVILGIGGINGNIVNNLFTGVLWLPVFNIGFGINAATLGVVVMVFKAWDAFLNPFVGNLSDNTRTKWGRRRPFIIVGSVLTGCFLPLVWWIPETMPIPWVITLLVVIGLLLYTAFTLWVIPFEALIMEMTPNYDERTNIMSYLSFFGKIMSLLGGWVLAFVTSDIFADANGEANIIAGARFVSIFFGAIIILLGILPGLFVKERNYEKRTSKQASQPFIQSVKDTTSIVPLWFLIGMIFFNMIGIVSISGLGYYMNIYFVNQGEIAEASWIEGWRNTAMFAVGLMSIPFWRWVSGRWDKRVAMYLISSMTIFGHCLNY